MKRHLFFSLAIAAVTSTFAQNGKHATPSGIIETKSKKLDLSEPLGSNVTTFSGPTKQVKHKLNGNSLFKTTACVQFTGSMNVLGYLVSQSKPLQYNKGVNAVSMIARKSSTYTASSNSNSGTIVGLYSTNLGLAWNETCIWANGASLARYPQGGIYNPLGNTNINNAYLVGTGPFTSSAGGWGGPTNGNWYCSKQITTPGNTTPGADQQPSFYQGGFLKAHYMSRYSFTAIDGGLVRSLANIVADPAGTTNATFGLRGALMMKGQFNAGAFVWTVDSFIPPVYTRSDGSPLIGTASPVMAWDDNGQVGYVMILGSRAGANAQMRGFQPIVYKTSNGGSSWNLLPANDFADPACFQAVWDRLYPTGSNTTVICPNFAQSEGYDVTVDNNGQLHVVSMLIGHSSNHPDSMGYRYIYGTEQYNYGYTGSFDYPTIYDFYTRPAGGWDYHVVDSMVTEGPSGTSGQPGFGSNIWSDGSGGKMDQDARIQISRTDDGSKIYYSWTESDPTLLGLNWNVYPDLKLRGYDVNSKMVTPRMNVTTGITNADQSAYYHYMSNKAAGPSSGCTTMPLTITYNSTYNGGIDVNTFYLDGIQVCANSFSIAAMSPKNGCTIGMKEENVFNYTVSNFPNPAHEATTILVDLKEPSAFDVVIYNSVGQVVESYKLNGHNGVNEINVDLTGFSAGVYFYNVKVGNSVVSKKLIVQ